MATIILVLLFSAGVLAQQQPPLALKFRQDSSGVAYKWPSVALAKQAAVGKHQDESEFASGSDSDLGTNQVTVKSEALSTNIDFDEADSDCDFPFVSVGSGCYHFSSEQLNFADAEAYCENLAHGHTYEVTLAMMEYDGSEDQALLDAVTERSSTFWIGGSTEDSVNWSWMDGRPMFLQAPLWYYSEPNTVTNKCVVAQISASGNNVRSYLYDSDCNVSLNFICQTKVIFPDQLLEFRKIGNAYYFLSEEVGLPHAHWQEAHDYCTGLSVPVGYHSNLAVLTMTHDDYDLMNNFCPADAASNCDAWIGLVAEDDDCTFKFIDGRQLSISSSYWLYTQPSCGSEKFVALRHYFNINQTYLIDWPDSASYTWPFICQLFQDD